MFPSNADIRKFTQGSFSDSELETFCFDYFPEVSDEFTVGMLKSKKVLLLIEYCQRRELMANLLAALRKERPKSYDNEFSSLSASDKGQQVSQSPEKLDQVFICYAREDLELASRLANSLKKEGYSVWIAPESIHPGEKWVTAINRGLEESNIFILLLTSAAVNSKWVRSETDTAIDMEHRGEIRIIPLLAQPCSLPPIWRTYQHIAFWHDFEKGWAELLVELNRPDVGTATFLKADLNVVENDSTTLLDNSMIDHLEWYLPAIDQMLVRYYEGILLPGYILRDQIATIEGTLANFNRPATVVEVNDGPSVTQYCVEPSYYETFDGSLKRTRYEDVIELSLDLALSLAASDVQIYSIPERGMLAIDVPKTRRDIVGLRDVLDSSKFRSIEGTLKLGLGFMMSGKPLVSSMTELQNLLLVGRTGSGKSVLCDTIISGLLLQNTPRDLRLLLIDSRRELIHYGNIAHLVDSIAVESKQMVDALKWALNQVELRILSFQERRVTNLIAYNLTTEDRSLQLPYVIVFISELADLINEYDDTQRIIGYIARMALKTGVHLIAATRPPTIEVITNHIKVSFPTHLLFAMKNAEESMRLLGRPGAEKLLGKGDMIAVLPNHESPVRIQGVYISDSEVEKIIRFWSKDIG